MARETIRTATVKSTGEKLTVYQLENGQWHDYENMGADKQPSAHKSGKKKFEEHELTFE